MAFRKISIRAETHEAAKTDLKAEFFNTIRRREKSSTAYFGHSTSTVAGKSNLSKQRDGLHSRNSDSPLGFTAQYVG